jgi:P4 family phage/plasmid primase-like protien
MTFRRYLLAEAERLNGNYHIYTGIHPLRERPSEGRGKEKDILGIALFAADVDAKDFIKDPVEKQKANEERAFYRWTDELLSECKALALAHIRQVTDKVSLPPTAIIDSGHGYYPVFKLLKFIEFESDQHREELKKLNKKLHEVFSADSTFDFARILRVIETRNIKPGYPTDCRLIEFHPDRRYILDDIRRFEKLIELPHRRFFTVDNHTEQQSRPVEGWVRCVDTTPSTVERIARLPQAILLDDQELIEKAKNAKDGAKFSALWNGDISEYKSQSEADLALCCLLAFWTGGDRDRIDRLFRQSGLYREDKWGEREDYRKKTIDAALSRVTEFYDPRNNDRMQGYGTQGKTVKIRTESHLKDESEKVHSPVEGVVSTLTGGSFTADDHKKASCVVEGVVERIAPSIAPSTLDAIPDKVLDAMAEQNAIVQEVDLFQKKKTKEDFCPYFKKDTFIPKLLADDILSNNRFINVKGLLYRYYNGVYIDNGEQFIEAESQSKLGNESRQNRISETVYYIKVDSYTEPELVNPTDKGHLINVQNGLYDWIEGKLLPHTPDHLSTIRIPIEYNPEATCPTVDYFLESTLPKDCIPIAEELFGYALIPYVRFEKAFMFTGTGANGKSTFLTLLEKFVGSGNVSKVPLQDLDEHRFKRAELFGKLLNLFADLDARDLQSSTYFKTIVSGDAIDAERKFQDPFFFRPFARLAFSANEIPRSPDNSYAYFRRWCIIPFPKRFEGRNADKSLADKMTEPDELSGLLNRALRGLHRLFNNEEFTESATIKASLDDYKKQNDTVAAFVNDCCVFDVNAETERGELFTAYQRYCESEGYKEISRIACYNRIRAHSQISEKREMQGKRYFTGIKIQKTQ